MQTDIKSRVKLIHKNPLLVIASSEQLGSGAETHSKLCQLQLKKGCDLPQTKHIYKESCWNVLCSKRRDFVSLWIMRIRMRHMIIDPICYLYVNILITPFKIIIIITYFIKLNFCAFSLLLW